MALNEIVTSIQRDIATLTATAAQTQDHLATPILPQQAIVGPRRLRVHRVTVDQLQITVNPQERSRTGRDRRSSNPT
ncbi:hypothetical protein OHA25_04040 [Nonomuraea sp. NBC_00507]|uniref:hypothetical protein n=1 Tax=Nonomuraea sp. NBC_00507 TaxID=2976002 RepID=UPI002E183AF4